MFYRVTADLIFSVEDEATDFYHDCQLACPKSIAINEGQNNEERGHILYQRCFHNEVPSQPCEVIEEQWCPPPAP